MLAAATIASDCAATICAPAMLALRKTAFFCSSLIIFSSSSDADGGDGDAVVAAPLLGEHMIHGFGEIIRVTRQSAVADPLLGDLRKGGLQGGQELAL